MYVVEFGIVNIMFMDLCCSRTDYGEFLSGVSSPRQAGDLHLVEADT